MAGMSKDSDRQVIPQWRAFEVTRDRGELSPLLAAKSSNFQTESLDALQEDWKSRPTISIAADLVSTAFVLGREADALQAAQFLADNTLAPSAARSIAEICLRSVEIAGEKPPESRPRINDSEPDPQFEHGFSRQFHAQIRQTRKRLVQYQRNAVLWANLARLFTSVGSQHKAIQAMRVARSLAPHNRFVLRSASRLMLHLGEGKDAHRILKESPILQFDPWILSAEIATAAAIGKRSQYVKLGRRIIESSRFQPFCLSELASALGTLEAIAGNRRVSRRLIEQSLLRPTENAVAQAAFLIRNHDVTTSEGPDFSLSAEACTWHAFRGAKWDLAIRQVKKWIQDQPFSSRPAAQGSHMASTIFEDFRLAEEYAKIGLLSNPDDISLINNLAFALAKQDRVEEAIRALNRLDPRRIPPEHAIFIMATAGLIEFRSGRIESGRLLYRRSIELAHRMQHDAEKVARIYFAIEELRVKSPQSELVRKEAIDGAESLSQPWQAVLLRRLERYKPPETPDTFQTPRIPLSDRFGLSSI